jgi:primosomal protein N' (replication factor Y) (superfamily II helicase)
MYVTVKLLNGCQQRLTYSIPSSWQLSKPQGAVVTVPLRQRTELALIEEVIEKPTTHYSIKEAITYEPILSEPLYKQFMQRLSAYHALDPVYLYKRLCAFLKQSPEKIETNAPDNTSFTTPLQAGTHLTHEQQHIVDAIAPYITNTTYQPCVLHGVTGSGKTEVYYRLMQHAASLGKAILFLLPEVALAAQFAKLFRARNELNIPIFDFHSATSAPDKRALWQALRTEQPLVAIGVHLPILLPLRHLGIIIIDEEHETGYQEKKHPKINTKEGALLRAATHQIPILLGSATPSIATLHNVNQRGWKLFTLEKRFSGAFPDVKVVKLTPCKEKRAYFWISKELEQAIADRLSKKEQILIFINRRGYSFFVQCSTCGSIVTCNNCSVSLTLHEGNILRCHYCNFSMTLAPEHVCLQCKGTTFIKKGIGTQQVVTIIQQLFPYARIDRADLDATINRKKWQKTIQAFHNQEIDILVGTQTITKGYHFPHVTLVGILWADIQLSMPTYNAAETTLQQLIQVAGRAGRQHPNSTVIVQTMLDHTLYTYLPEERYRDFYAYEAEHRHLLCYPPFVRFAEIELRHSRQEIVEKESAHYADALADHIKKDTATAITILGPAQPPVHKIKNMHIRKIYLKAEKISDLSNLYQTLQAIPWQSTIFFTPNPLTL